jgi:predicted DNA-binding protein (MmcQ/YjbR family)
MQQMMQHAPFMAGLIRPPPRPAKTNAPRRGRMAGMSRDLVNSICRGFPGAEVSDPWGGGHDAWKVGGRMFACIGAVMPGVSVKTDSIDTAEMLIAAGVGVKAPYLHRSWINLPWGTPEDELRHRLTQSYRLVRSGLPKKVQAGLGPLP